MLFCDVVVFYIMYAFMILFLFTYGDMYHVVWVVRQQWYGAGFKNPIWVGLYEIHTIYPTAKY